MEYQVMCVSKDDRKNPYERITHIGGYVRGSTTYGAWRVSQQHAIEEIEGGRLALYVDQGGLLLDVVVAVNQNGDKYIKTDLDGLEPNGLLSLPECPGPIDQHALVARAGDSPGSPPAIP
jgi:hypothetical protein